MKILFWGYLIFVFFDMHYFIKTKYPEKVSVWWWIIPGSGFLTYWKFGPRLENKSIDKPAKDC